jgi:F-type H+-transporting ATPase subunit b
MELLSPGIGLIFWQTLTFLTLVFLLGKFAWKPILKAVQEREKSIEDALKQADKARKEMEALKSDNERLMAEARAQGEVILQEAKQNAIAYEAKRKEETEAKIERMLVDANAKLDKDRVDMMNEVRGIVANLSVDVAEKLLRRELSDKKTQETLVNSLLDEIKLS